MFLLVPAHQVGPEKNGRKMVVAVVVVGLQNTYTSIHLDEQKTFSVTVHKCDIVCNHLLFQ